jgi:hypothetical protein
LPLGQTALTATSKTARPGAPRPRAADAPAARRFELIQAYVVKTSAFRFAQPVVGREEVYLSQPID